MQLILRKNESFTFEEFKIYLEQRKYYRNLSTSGKIKHHLSNSLLKNKLTKSLTKIAIITLAVLFVPQIAYAGDATAMLTSTYSKFLFAFRIVCLGMAIFESGKAMMNGSANEVPKVLIKYLIGYGGVVALPYLFNWVETFLKGVLG